MPRSKASADPVVGRIVGSKKKTFAQTLRMIPLSKELIETDDFAIERDADCQTQAKAFEHLLKMGLRAEQQAFAKFDLNFVLDRYLPERLKHTERFLP